MFFNSTSFEIFWSFLLFSTRIKINLYSNPSDIIELISWWQTHNQYFVQFNPIAKCLTSPAENRLYWISLRTANKLNHPVHSTSILFHFTAHNSGPPMAQSSSVIILFQRKRIQAQMKTHYGLINDVPNDITFFFFNFNFYPHDVCPLLDDFFAFFFHPLFFI